MTSLPAWPAVSMTPVEYVGMLLRTNLADLREVELPCGLAGTCVIHAVRGGGKVILSDDGTMLFADSTVDYDTMVNEFRNGRRTPLHLFEWD